MKYVVEVSPKPGREELKWAMRFTVRARDRVCQTCGTSNQPLDVAHIKSRTARPDLEWEPSNARLLCRSCHMAADHRDGHRPSGRPDGYRMSEESKRKISEGGRRAKANPEWRRKASERSKMQWDERGRKPQRDCENCGKPLTRIQLTRNYRFCGKDCRYSFATGKPRTGW